MLITSHLHYLDLATCTINQFYWFIKTSFSLNMTSQTGHLLLFFLVPLSKFIANLNSKFPPLGHSSQILHIHQLIIWWQVSSTHWLVFDPTLVPLQHLAFWKSLNRCFIFEQILHNFMQGYSLHLRFDLVHHHSTISICIYTIWALIKDWERVTSTCDTNPLWNRVLTMLLYAYIWSYLFI